MNFWAIMVIVGIVILVGTVIATAVDKTWENMKKTTEYTKQKIRDSERILEIIKDMGDLIEEIEASK